MNLRKDLPRVALAAFVTGATVLVYALGGHVSPVAEAKDAAPSDRSPDLSAKAKEEAKDTSPGDGPLYDATALPEPVQRMLRKIILTAQTGDIEDMRAVLESNELKPMVAAAHVDDPIAYWKEHSVDGTGRDVLAAMLNMLNAGFVLTGEGHDAMYVWPYFAEVDITALSPQQEVELYRTIPPKDAKAMKEAGTYDYYRLGVSPAGVWHYFIR